VPKPEGKIPLGTSRCKWENNIEMGLQEMGWGMDWIDLAQKRGRWWVKVNAVMNSRVL